MYTGQAKLGSASDGYKHLGSRVSGVFGHPIRAAVNRQRQAIGTHQFNGQNGHRPVIGQHAFLAKDDSLVRPLWNVLAAEEAPVVVGSRVRQLSLEQQHPIQQHKQPPDTQPQQQPDQQPDQPKREHVAGSSVYTAPQRLQDVNCGSLVKAYLQLLKQHNQASQAIHSHDSSNATSSRAAEDRDEGNWHRLLQQTQAALQQLQPQQSSLILYALAKLNRQAPTALLNGLVDQLQLQQLQQLPPAGVTNVIWALAVLGHHPRDSSIWFSSFFTASSNLLKQQQVNHHQLTSLIWSAGQLKQQPPADWVEAVLAGLRPSLSLLSPTQLSNTVWGLAQIGYRPDRVWCKKWFAASYKALPQCNAHHLACITGSLALLRLSTSNGRWLVRFRQCVQYQLLQVESKQIATIVCGLAKRLSNQPPHWVTLLIKRQLQLLQQQPMAGQQATAPAAQQQQQQQQLARRTADIAATVWALPRLLYPTPKAWGTEPKNTALLRQLAAVSLPLLPVCSAAELVQLAVGFAGLSFHPGTHWLKVHENAIAAKYSHLNEHNKARLRAAIKKLWLGG